MTRTVNFSGAYGHNVQMDLNYGTVSQNPSGNSSRIRVWVTLRSNGYGAIWGNYPLSVNVNGISSTENVPVNINTNSSVTIWVKEYDISHSGDGTKTVSISASLTVNVSGYGVASASTNYTLATIARASTVSIGQVVIGQSVTVSISRKSSSAKHVIRYGFGAANDTIATNVDTTYIWHVPPELAKQIPNDTASKGTIWVDTYFGNTKVGTSAAVFDISIPDSYKPTLSSISLADTNVKAQSLFPDPHTYIKDVSNVKITFNGASGAPGSTIAQYEAVIVGKSNSTGSNGGTLGNMPYSGSAVVRARVQDSRGRWSDPKDVTINILPYHTPKLSFTVVREGKDGSKLSIKREAVISSLMAGNTQKNTLSLAFKVAKGASTVFTVDNGPAAGTWNQPTIVTEAVLAGTYPTDSAWVVEGVLSDKFNSAKFRVVVPTASAVGAYDKNGRWGFGQIPDRGKPGSINVAGDIYANGKLIQQHQLTNNNGRSPYNASGTVDLNTKTVNSFFSCNEPKNGPSVGTGLNQFYIAVYSESDNYLSQNAIQKNSGRMFTRTRHNGNWTAWTVQGLDSFYPVGSIYQSTSSVNPTTFMGGTWERFGNGRVLVGVDENDADFNTSGKTGGGKLLAGLRRVAAAFGLATTSSYGGRVVVADQNKTSAEVDVTSSNLQPYIAIYRWRRTA